MFLKKRKTVETTGAFGNIPQEVFFIIFCFWKIDDVCRSQRISKALRNCVNYYMQTIFNTKFTDEIKNNLVIMRLFVEFDQIRMNNLRYGQNINETAIYNFTGELKDNPNILRRLCGNTTFGLFLQQQPWLKDIFKRNKIPERFLKQLVVSLCNIQKKRDLKIKAVYSPKALRRLSMNKNSNKLLQLLLEAFRRHPVIHITRPFDPTVQNMLKKVVGLQKNNKCLRKVCLELAENDYANNKDNRKRYTNLFNLFGSKLTSLKIYCRSWVIYNPVYDDVALFELLKKNKGTLINLKLLLALDKKENYKEFFNVLSQCKKLGHLTLEFDFSVAFDVVKIEDIKSSFKTVCNIIFNFLDNLPRIDTLSISFAGEDCCGVFGSFVKNLHHRKFKNKNVKNLYFENLEYCPVDPKHLQGHYNNSNDAVKTGCALYRLIENWGSNIRKIHLNFENIDEWPVYDVDDDKSEQITYSGLYKLFSGMKGTEIFIYDLECLIGNYAREIFKLSNVFPEPCNERKTIKLPSNMPPIFQISHK